MESQKVFLLKQELNAFLEEHPQYKAMQKEIEETLSQAGSSHNRLVLLDKMMKEKLYELSLKMQDLSSSLVNLQHQINQE